MTKCVDEIINQFINMEKEQRQTLEKKCSEINSSRYRDFSTVLGKR